VRLRGALIGSTRRRAMLDVARRSAPRPRFF